MIDTVNTHIQSCLIVTDTHSLCLHGYVRAQSSTFASTHVLHPSKQHAHISTRAIVVDGDGNVTERKLADQSPGKMLSPSVDVLHHSVTNGKRTVILTRALKGKGVCACVSNATPVICR